jgi:hypothetical protein
MPRAIPDASTASRIASVGNRAVWVRVVSPAKSSVMIDSYSARASQ